MEILHQGEPDARSLKEAIDELVAEQGLGPVDLDVRPVPEADWQSAVQADFPPQRIGRFTVYGSHIGENPYPGSTPLRLDAGLAFGSGEHATTRGCLVMLDDLARRRRFRRVLDLGCGSGILAIAAARCWPARVVAADNDPAAVAVARMNVSRNGVARVRTVLSEGFQDPTLRAGGPYDLILANILAGPLIELASAFAGALADDGVVVVSGLLGWQVASVRARYRLHGLRIARLLEDGPWATLMFRNARRRTHGHRKP